MSYEYIQKPTLSVVRAMEIWGGWSRMFARGVDTREEQDIIASERDPRFWELWAITRMEEQLKEEIEQCINELRKQYPNDKRHKKVLIPLLKKALIKAGWKPNISLIQREIKTLKKERKEELRWLKASIRKR